MEFKKAFLNGRVTREICIELPDEDEKKDGGRMVGLLHRAMYGLRDAPAIWAAVVADMMLELGFVKCTTANRAVRLCARGDWRRRGRARG